MATDEPDLDVQEQFDDHYLPQSLWDAVVERAEEIHEERAAEPGGGAGDFDPMGITPKYLDFPNSPYDKSSTLQRRQLFVIHTAECPLRVGYAQSLTEWADGDSYNPRVSWHRFVDPATVARFIVPKEAAWHAAGANALSNGYEQSGYASYTREQWLSPDGRRQLDLLSQQLVKDGLTLAGARRLSDAEVSAILSGADKTTQGLCSHEQISRLSGRSSRTDPGKGYPWDVLVEGVRHYLGAGPAPVPPPKPTTPKPALAEDGKWGPGTSMTLQRLFGTKVDGEVSNQTYAIRDANPGLKARPNWEFNGTRRGSDLIRAMQRWLRAKGLYAGTIDGLAGPMFWRGLYRKLGVTWDGNIDNPDPAIKKMQQQLNRKTFK